VDEGLRLTMNLLRLVAIWLTLGAAVFPGMWAPPSWGGQAGMDLNPADKQLLLQVARDTIAAQLQGKAATPVKAASAVLKEFRGAFVSLHRRGNCGVASAILKQSNLSCKR
jgi:hypothetical protein